MINTAFKLNNNKTKGAAGKAILFNKHKEEFEQINFNVRQSSTNQYVLEVVSQTVLNINRWVHHKYLSLVELIHRSVSIDEEFRIRHQTEALLVYDQYFGQEQHRLTSLDVAEILIILIKVNE